MTGGGRAQGDRERVDVAGRRGAVPELRRRGPSGGFEHGGWHSQYFDDMSMQWVVENVTSAGGYLLGRGTYELFPAHWPNASEEEQMLARPLSERPKYVASTTLTEPLG